MNSTVLAVIAAGQMVFFVVVFLLLVGYRWIDNRRKRTRRMQADRLARVLRDILEGKVGVDVFRAELELVHGNVVVSVLHQYAAQVGGEPWEWVVESVRQSDWFSGFLAPRARSRFWWKRLVAARLLAIVGRDEDLTYARALIADRHPAIKVAGIQVVRRISDASLLQVVLDEALSAQPVVRRYLFDTLVSVRQILVPVLAERIENAETIDELRALITLGGELAAVELFDRLLSYVDHEGLEIRVAVARALGSYPHPRSEATLIAFLGDEVWQVRTQAASSLGLIRAAGARDALREVLSDSNWWVRLRAAVALRQLGLEGTHVLTDAQKGADRFAEEMARYVLGLSEQAVADYLT